jgi:tocopherol cyclase
MAILLALLLVDANAAWAQAHVKPKVIAGERAAGYSTAKIWKPAIFQGGNRKHDYYEGWYIKCVSADGSRSFALIPGLAMGSKGKHGHAFIQYIDGKTAETHWYEFPATDFYYSQRRFAVMIGSNYFSSDSVHVDVGEGTERLQVALKLSGLHPWKVKPLSPGIMGWYRFVPGMETCHGMVSMDHGVEGTIVYGGVSAQMLGARGYIEKDWGSSFPRSYVWMQSNRFERDSVSFMCSIATIPYLGKYFTGFLGFLWVDGKVYRFATYTHAHLRDVQLTENTASFVIEEGKWRIVVQATRRNSGLLKAPQSGEMERRIAESVDAEIGLQLFDRKGKLLFQGKGQEAGLEIVGKREELMGE